VHILSDEDFTNLFDLFSGVVLVLKSMAVIALGVFVEGAKKGEYWF